MCAWWDHLDDGKAVQFTLFIRFTHSTRTVTL